jgi:hypothetical protein
MPVYVMQKTLWEVADVIEQIYTIAFTENLQPDLEDREAAILDYRAEQKVARTTMQERLRCCYVTMTEIRLRGQLIKLMRLYNNGSGVLAARAGTRLELLRKFRRKRFGTKTGIENLHAFESA